MMHSLARLGRTTSASSEAPARIRSRESGPENNANLRRPGAPPPSHRKAEKSSSKIVLRLFSMVRKDPR